jgi:hypothetical protein
MIRVSAALVLVLASFGSTACADNILKERPATRVARTPVTKPAFSAVGDAKGQSSVCAAYQRQLRVVQLRQALATSKPIAAELKSKELSLNAIIADACE